MIRKLLYLAAVLLFLLLSYFVYDYISYNHHRETNIHERGRETTLELRNQVDGILAKIQSEGKRLAELFGANDYTVDEIERIIKESSLSIPEIQGVTACYEPNAFSDGRRLYCPYYNKGDQNYLQVEDNYDYSIIAKGSEWYTDVRDEGAKWVEPYFAKAAKDWYIDYGIPFYFSAGPRKGEVRGTITMSFICGGFKNLVHGLSLGKTGYGMITSKNGTFLAHPINEYIGTTNIKTVLEEESQTELVDAYNGILRGEKGHVEYYDTEKQDESLFYYDRIPTAGWGIGLLFFRDDLLNDTLSINRKKIRIGLWLSLFLVIILTIYYNKDDLDRGEIWIISVVSTLLLLINILYVGLLKHNTHQRETGSNSPPIVDMSTLNSFLNKSNARSDLLKIEKLTPIPTGLYVERMEFQDSYNLNIGGKVWQKYPLDEVDKVSIGFTFPQMSPFAEASYIEESARDTISGREDEAPYLLVAWDFRVTLMLDFNYTNFPLDKRKINIELTPLNNGDHLVFVPDLASYNYTNPSQKSGLNPKIHISGSTVLESYFNFSQETYDTDFGFGVKGMFEEVPVLHYNITLRRILINAFVTYLIPIFVTLIMMFILIHACGKTDERQGIIESMAAFFFVLIFSHIDMRKEIVTADLIFMEYFYFATYAMIILSTFNLITYAKDKSPLFDYNENQFAKATYFPLFLLMILVVTLFKFY